MNKNETAIEVTSLKKAYKNNQVLKGINFTVKKGQIFALLGSNGAGKTTTVKILSTLMKPDEGSAEISGFDIVKESRRVRECISLTGQYAAVDENSTGRENLHMIGSLRHLKDKKKQTDELLQRFELKDAADKRVSTYSGGMCRKLDLSMSLMGRPDVIFLDEPTTGLDPQSRLAMWKIVKSLSESGTTIFLTTQYLEEAERLADYIAILNDGIIAAEGTVNELKNRVPNGTIEFSFYEESEVEKAICLLKDYKTYSNAERATLSVVIDDGIEQLSNILNALKTSGIIVSRFEQKLPTLEDVFLALIGNDSKKKEGKNG